MPSALADGYGCPLSFRALAHELFFCSHVASVGFKPNNTFCVYGVKTPKREGRDIYPLAKAQRQVWNGDFKRQAKAAAIIAIFCLNIVFVPVFSIVIARSIFVSSLWDGMSWADCVLPSDNSSGIKRCLCLDSLAVCLRFHPVKIKGAIRNRKGDFPFIDLYSSRRDGSSVENCLR